MILANANSLYGLHLHLAESGQNLFNMPVSIVLLAERITFLCLMCCWIFRICTYFIMHIRYPCCPKRCHPDVSVSLFPPIQVCVHSHGSPGPAAHGLPLSEHQPVCGEFSKDGAQAARVRKIQPADPRNQLCEFPGLYSQFKTAIRCFFYILFFEFCSYEENKLRKPCRF